MELEDNPEINREIGQRIKNAREAAGLTQTDISIKTKVTRQQVSRWEKGENKISIPHLRIVAKLVKVPLEILAGSKELPSRPRSSTELLQIIDTMDSEIQELRKLIPPLDFQQKLKGLDETELKTFWAQARKILKLPPAPIELSIDKQDKKDHQ